MSLAGGVIIGVYLLLLPLIKRYFTARWRYFILKLAGIFFVVPFPCYKQYYLDFLSFIFNITRKEHILSEQIELQRIQIDANGRIISGINEIFNVFTVTWFGVGLAFFIYHIINYMIFKKRFLADAYIVVDEQIDSILKYYKSKLCIKSKIRVLNNKYIVEPFTIGILFPIILLPKYNYSYEELELILYHEMCHIKNKDLFIKLCGLSAIAIHWFNPLVYIFYRELGIVCENVCDEKIVIDQSIEFRKRYGNLIIDTIEKKEIYSNALIISFSGNKKVTKERILMMKNVKRPKNFVKALSVIGSVCIVLLEATTVFAYDASKLIKWKYRTKIKNDLTLITSKGDFSVEKDIGDNIQVIKYNLNKTIGTSYQFIDETGDIYEVDRISEELYSSEKACNHSYISGTLSEHIMSADRSCIHIINKASKCKICNNILTNGSYEEHKYAECPH